MASVPPAPEPQLSRSTALALFTFLLLWIIYTLSYQGLPISDDEQLFVSTAINLAGSGEFSAGQMHGNNRLQGQYYGVGPLFVSLLAPLTAAARMAGLGQMQAAFLLNPLITALTGALIILLAGRWGYPPGATLLAALAFGLGSIAWPYARTAFREPLAGLLLVAAWLGLETSLQAKNPAGRRWALAGTAAALTALFFSKVVVALAALPAFGAVLLHPAARKRLPGLLGLAAAALLLTLLLPAVVRARVSPEFIRLAWERVAGISHQGFWLAAAGSLFSPAKGLFIYSPALLLAVFCQPPASRRHLLLPALVTGALIVFQALAYDSDWWNVTWGTRYLLPAVPLLALAALPVLQAHPRLGAALVAAGALIQLGGVWVSDPTYLSWFYRQMPTPYPGILWQPGAAPVAGHWRLAFAGSPPDLLWARLLPLLPRSTALIYGGLAGCLLWALYRLVRIVRAGTAVHRAALMGLPLLLALNAGLLFIAREDPRYYLREPNLSAVSDSLQTLAQPGDVLVLHSYLSPAWYREINFHSSAVPWYSLPLENQRVDGESNQLPDAEILFFENLSLRHNRIWLLSDPFRPDSVLSAPRQFLDMRFTLQKSQQFSLARPDLPLSLRLYSFRPHPKPEAPTDEEERHPHTF